MARGTYAGWIVVTPTIEIVSNFYIRLTEARIQSELESGPFLGSESLPPSDATQCRNTVQSGKIYITEMHTRNEEGKEVDIPKGRIHHWLGVILVRGAYIDYVLDWVKDCRNFETAIPHVVASQEISRQGDTLRMFLEVKGGRIRTAYYNTEHIVEYKGYGAGRTFSRTQATRIANGKTRVNPAKERNRKVGTAAICGGGTPIGDISRRTKGSSWSASPSA